MISLTELDACPRTGLPALDAFLTAGWRRQRVPQAAPVTPVSLRDDVGDWLISSYGENLALGFKGSTDFIRRCYNWAANTGVIHKGQKLNWFHEAVTGRLAYVCPKSVEQILAGLTLQFQAEIIQSREVLPLKEGWTEDDEWVLELDEIKVEDLARARARAFMEERVVRDSFVLDRLTRIGDTYSVGAPGREWRSD